MQTLVAAALRRAPFSSIILASSFLCSQAESTLLPAPRIRDGVQTSGYPVCTFASILKYERLPLAEILTEILALGRKGMGCPVEIEFAVDMPSDTDSHAVFELLQIRPMAVNQSNLAVEISEDDVSKAFCYSTMALGNGRFAEIQDIILVNPDRFDAADTIKIAFYIVIYIL